MIRTWQRGVGINRLVFQDAPHQAEAIAVDPAAGDGHDGVAGHHAAAVNHLSGFHHGHAEAGQVVATGPVEARHFSGFPTQQGAAALEAAIGNAFHHLRHRLGAELAGGDVVEEEQGFGAAGDDVVDAHRHQVDAHIVVMAVGLGQLQLGANPITPCHQEGVLEARR